MATVINNPSTESRGTGESAGFLIGIVVAVLLLILFVIYGLPRIQNINPATTQPTETNINVTNPPSQSQTPEQSPTTPTSPSPKSQ